MDSIKCEILTDDKRYNHISKFQNYISNTSETLNWYCEVENQNSKACEIILEKVFENATVTFRITTTLLNNHIIISVDKTSFHSYGIENFLVIFLGSIDKNLYRIVPIKSKIEKVENNSDNILNQIFTNFHRSAQQLLKRHDKRETLIINDEYDVQDYLHSLLLLFFDDVRDEDPVPKKAGASSRGDFFLPREGIMIETKISSDNNKDKDIGEQITVDIKRYTANKDIKKIYFFVYNPNYKLKNPKGLEDDLSNDKNIDVVVKVFPK